MASFTVPNKDVAGYTRYSESTGEAGPIVLLVGPPACRVHTSRRPTLEDANHDGTTIATPQHEEQIDEEQIDEEQIDEEQIDEEQIDEEQIDEEQIDEDY